MCCDRITHTRKAVPNRGVQLALFVHDSRCCWLSCQIGARRDALKYSGTRVLKDLLLLLASRHPLTFAYLYPIGSPTRFGMMCAQMKAFFDSTGSLWAKGAPTQSTLQPTLCRGDMCASPCAVDEAALTLVDKDVWHTTIAVR